MPPSDEYAKPRGFIVHSPKHNLSLRLEASQDLSSYNFSLLPDWQKAIYEFKDITSTLKRYGFDVYEMADLLDEHEQNILAQDPNSIFTRDPVITLPWLPNWAILSNMSLATRKNEPYLMKAAVHKLGVNRFFEPPPDVRLEGGDVIPIVHQGQRTLFIGNGSRTNMEAALWIAEQLIPPGHLDEIMVINHNRAMLHLDTCFCILPQKTILCATDTYRDGYLIDGEMKLKPIDPLDYLKSQNYKLIYIKQRSAELDEGCNLLHIGGNNYLSFGLPPELVNRLEAASNIKVHQINGSEISKANGGTHCLTLPIY